MKRYIKASIDNLEQLANDLDQFYYDFDPYDYWDSADSRESGYQDILIGLSDPTWVKQTIIYLNSLVDDLDESDAFYEEAKSLIDRLNGLA